MNERVRIEQINGIEVNRIDLSGLSGTELIKCCCDIMDYIQQINKKSFFLIDISNCKLNIEALSFLKSAGKNVQIKVEKSAITGVNRHLEPFFKMYLKYTGSKMVSFSNDEEAIGYITQIAALNSKKEKVTLSA